MTHEKVFSMKPGRELDVIVAEKVMGWRKKTFPGGGGGFTAWVDENEKVMKLISNSTMSETCYRCDYFRPSTDIAAAWEVVEKMTSLFWEMNLDTGSKSNTTKVEFYRTFDQTFHVVVSNTAPEAICKAALLAVMGE